MSEALAVVTTCWGLLMGLAPLLQVRVIVRTGDADGTALGWVFIILVGSVLWLTYGLVNTDAPIVITNVVAVAVTTTLAIIVRVYRTRASAAVAITGRPRDLRIRLGSRRPPAHRPRDRR